MVVNMEGVVSQIFEHKNLGANWVVEFILTVPPYVKDGKELVKEQNYTVQIWGKEESHVTGIGKYLNQKVKIECYLNGIKSQKDEKVFFTNKLAIKNLQAI